MKKSSISFLAAVILSFLIFYACSDKTDNLIDTQSKVPGKKRSYKC